jgi:hypothetical protein
MPTPDERSDLEEAIGHAKASLVTLRSKGIDGPALWAAEAKVNDLLDEWAVTCRGL